MLLKNNNAVVLSLDEARAIHEFLTASCDECMGGISGFRDEKLCGACECGHIADRLGLLLKNIKNQGE